MQNTKILSLMAPVLVGATLISNYVLGRVQNKPIRHLPVEAFPRTLGRWVAKKDHVIDPEVQKKLPSAHIVNRLYEGENGQQIDVLLLSATEYTDFHDPTWCFPGQGFTVSKPEGFSIGSQAVRMITAERGGSHVRVLYWWTGNVTTDYSYGRKQISSVLELKNRLFAGRISALFVRLIVADTPGSKEGLIRFYQQIAPELQTLEKQQPPVLTAHK